MTFTQIRLEEIRCEQIVWGFVCFLTSKAIRRKKVSAALYGHCLTHRFGLILGVVVSMKAFNEQFGKAHQQATKQNDAAFTQPPRGHAPGECDAPRRAAGLQLIILKCKHNANEAAFVS
ncbi:hypothetical protein J6590_003000 [Homalodisca vitripennis]|nr:hypothetical protein J6590_003000 [Homalodisca vitripennis]